MYFILTLDFCFNLVNYAAPLVGISKNIEGRREGGGLQMQWGPNSKL